VPALNYLQIASTARASDAWQSGHSSASAGTLSPQFEHMTFSGKLQNGHRSSAASSTSAPQLGHGTKTGMPCMLSADSVLKQSSAPTQNGARVRSGVDLAGTTADSQCPGITKVACLNRRSRSL